MVFLMVQRFMKLQRKYRHIYGNDYFPLVVLVSYLQLMETLKFLFILEYIVRY